MPIARVWILALLAGPAALGQSTIELRPGAYSRQNSAVTLQDIARLDGPDAQALAGVEVAGSTPRSISIDDVRRALNASGKVNWGRLTLRGCSCELLGPAPEPKARPAAPEGPVRDDPYTVRGAVIAHLARMLRADPADLQLSFAPEDADYLATPTVGRTVEVHPTALAEKMPLRVTVYENDRIIGGERTIRVSVRVRREVAVAFVAKRRGETIRPDDYSTENRWVSPTVHPATADQLTGSAARDRVNPGDVIESDDAAPAFIVGKGDLVAIRCISGGIILGTRARALGPGRDGELVEFQALESPRRFFARMDGRGRAIISADTPKTDDDPPTPARRASLPVHGGRIPPPFSLEASR